MNQYIKPQTKVLGYPASVWIGNLGCLIETENGLDYIESEVWGNSTCESNETLITYCTPRSSFCYAGWDYVDVSQKCVIGKIEGLINLKNLPKNSSMVLSGCNETVAQIMVLILGVIYSCGLLFLILYFWGNLEAESVRKAKYGGVIKNESLRKLHVKMNNVLNTMMILSFMMSPLTFLAVYTTIILEEFLGVNSLGFFSKRVVRLLFHQSLAGEGKRAKLKFVSFEFLSTWDTLKPYEDIKDDLITSFPNDRSFFVSHKWYHDDPDDPKASLLSLLKSVGRPGDLFWLDFCCSSQQNVDMNEIKEAVLSISEMSLINHSLEMAAYHKSTWCQLEAIYSQVPMFIRPDRMSQLEIMKESDLNIVFECIMGMLSNGVSISTLFKLRELVSSTIRINTRMIGGSQISNIREVGSISW